MSIFSPEDGTLRSTAPSATKDMAGIEPLLPSPRCDATVSILRKGHQSNTAIQLSPTSLGFPTLLWRRDLLSSTERHTLNRPTQGPPSNREQATGFLNNRTPKDICTHENVLTSQTVQSNVFGSRVLKAQTSTAMSDTFKLSELSMMADPQSQSARQTTNLDVITPATQHLRSLGFEDLPPEVRLEVYKRYFRDTIFAMGQLQTSWHNETVAGQQRAVRRDFANLLLVSKTVHREAKQVLLHEATFLIPSNSYLMDSSAIALLSQGIRQVQYQWSVQNYEASLDSIRRTCCSTEHKLRKLTIVGSPFRACYLDWIPLFGIESAQEFSFSVYPRGTISSIRACAVKITKARCVSIHGLFPRDIEDIKDQICRVLGGLLPSDAEFILINTCPTTNVRSIFNEI